MRERIILTSLELFRIYGVRGTSMDQIAKELFLSKRTLYGHFENKKMLLQACIAHKIEEDAFFAHPSDNLLDDLLHCHEITRRFYHYSHRHLFELWEHYAEVYLYLEEVITEYAQCCCEKVAAGQAMGYIRPDVGRDFIGELIKEYLLKLLFCRCCFRGNRISQSTELMQAIMRGISTTKGVAYIDNQLTK